MKELLSKLFAQNITCREIFYFVNDRITSLEPHYYICIKKMDDDVLVFSICTTKIDTIRKYVISRSYPVETIVTIDPSDSPLPKECHINCNQYHPFTVDEFKLKHQNGEVKCIGVLPDKYYEQIVNGLCLSPEIEDELKDALNNA